MRALRLIVLALALIPAMSAQQSRDLTIEPVHQVPPGDHAALFVGINEFEDPAVTDLRFAVNDAVALAYLTVVDLKLIAPEDAMLILGGTPTTEPLRIQLSELEGMDVIVRRDADYTTLRDGLRFAARRGREFLLVSISSHGFTSEDERSYIMPADADLDYLVQRSLPLRDLQADIAQAGRSLVLIDACRNTPRRGALASRTPAAMAPAFREALGRFSGSAVLTSASVGEVSWEDETLGHGVFMHHVLEGLRGAAPADSSGLVRVGGLMRYVSEEVERHGLAQPGMSVQRPWYRGPEAARAIPLAVRLFDQRVPTRSVEDVYAEAKTLYEAENYLGALPLLKEAANRGHAGAQNDLGYMYRIGRVVQVNHSEAARLFRLAADQGHARAQFNLGIMYNHGSGMPKDKHEAVRLIRLAADQGLAIALFNLSVRYENGLDVPMDHREAVRFLRLAADQGFANAQARLGWVYEYGLGGSPRDQSEARRLYRLAAAQGHAGAQRSLDRLGG
ncbi:MAG: caspase family protein [Bacteroidota bacterium]